MGRDVDFRDAGVARFFEGFAGGLNSATMAAPPTLAADYDMELLDALPAGLEFLQINAAGKLSTALGTGGSLDAAYDFGGAGAGRIITADAGAVEITVPAASGNGALAIVMADNQSGIFINKTGTGAGSPILVTDAGTDTSLQVTKTGPSGNTVLFSGGGASLALSDLCDIQGDNTSGALSVTSLDVGSNAVIKTFQFGNGPALHVDNSANAFAARVRLESGSGVTDATIEFVQNSIQRWEVGYDQSAAKLIIAPTSFTTPIFSIADTTGLVKIESLAQDGNLLSLEKKAGNSGVALRIDNAGTSQSIEVDHTNSTSPAVRIRMRAGNYALRCIGDSFPTAIFQAGISAGANVEILNQSGGTGNNLFLNMDDNAVALNIDSEATSNPLILLAPITGNSRGDIAFGTARTTAPLTPSDGDLWYDGTLQRLEIRSGGVNFTAASRYVASSFPAFPIIAAGVATIVTGNNIFQAETGTTDDLDTITGSPLQQIADEITISADPGDTITVKHNTGNIHLDGSTDKVLVNGNHFKLKFNGTDWEQLTTMMVLL